MIAQEMICVLSKEDLCKAMKEVMQEAQPSEESPKRDDDDGLVSIKEASKRLGVDRSTLWRWDKTRYLVRIAIGGKKYYKESQIQGILNPKLSGKQ